MEPTRTTLPRSYKIQIALIKKTLCCSLVAISPLSFLFDSLSKHDSCFLSAVFVYEKAPPRLTVDIASSNQNVCITWHVFCRDVAKDKGHISRC
jgi:hypothetical protein